MPAACILSFTQPAHSCSFSRRITYFSLHSVFMLCCRNSASTWFGMPKEPAKAQTVW